MRSHLSHLELSCAFLRSPVIVTTLCTFRVACVAAMFYVMTKTLEQVCNVGEESMSFSSLHD